MFVAPRTEISWPSLAAEASAPYATALDSDAWRGCAAVGSPVAGRLGRVAEIAETRDRLMGELAGLLVSLSGEADLAEVTGGMSLHVWLQHQVRCTHAEARDVLGAAEVLRPHAGDVGRAVGSVAVVVTGRGDLPCGAAGPRGPSRRAGSAGGGRHGRAP